MDQVCTAPRRSAPRRTAPLRASPSPRAARCAHSRSETSSGSKKSDSAESLDDGGTAGTVKLFSEAAPALAPVAAAVPRGALTRVRRARVIGCGRAPARVRTRLLLPARRLDFQRQKGSVSL